MSAKWSFLCFQSWAWSHGSFGNCHLLAKRICWLAQLQSQEKCTKLFWLLWPVLCSWTMDILDPCSDDDINNDVNSLYVEIIDKNRTRMHDLWPKVFEERKTRNPLELCSRRRWETTQANHIRKYKRYLDDPSVPVPKSTRLDHNKRSATRSNTASHLDSSVGLSTELTVVPTESSASHSGETFAQDTEATKCDYKGTLEFTSANGYAQSEAFLSLERGGENEDTRLSFYITSKILYQTYKV